MELNAKIASLEDEVKLLKGEVKLILSEIRTAILGQDNPFGEPGQALRADPSALMARPPIRVVRVPSDDEEAESAPPEIPEEPVEALCETETEAPVPEPQLSVAAEPRVESPEPEAAPRAPVATAETPAPPPAPVVARSVEAEAPPRPPAPAAATTTPPAPVTRSPQPLVPDTTRWSMITVAGLAVWAEEAIKQIGPKRLHVLLDLCEFTGYISAPAKEALLKVSSLGPPAEKRATPPTANECLVVLYQLDALLRAEESAGQTFRGLAEKWRQPA